MNSKINFGIIATLIIAVIALGVAIFKSPTLSQTQISEIVRQIQLQLGATGTRFPNGLSTDTTSPSSGEVRTTLLTVTGTSTVTQSIDGIMVGGKVSSVGTTSVNFLYTNTTGPKSCSTGSPSYVRQLKIGTFAPSLNIAVGTTTSSGTVLLSILATTTTATSSSQYLTLTERRFLLDNNDQIALQLADSQANTSSSTYYGNLSYEVGIFCQDASI